MKPSQKALDLIKKYEGFRSEAYLCPAGVWTVGYGTTEGVTRGVKITREFAEKLLQEDLEARGKALLEEVFVPINQNQFDALLSFVYNVGIGAFRRSTLRKLVNSKRFEEAAREFLKWNKAGGRVLPGLTTRRQEEMALFKSPEGEGDKPGVQSPGS